MTLTLKMQLLPACSALLACTLFAGCRDTTPASDARGNYQLTYDDTFTVRLKVGGA